MNRLAETPILILCGGLGTRLREVIADRPKGLAPIGETPFLEIQLELLKRQGARKFVLCVGHQAELIEKHFGDGSRFGFSVQYSFEEPGKLMGTAGALRLAKDHAQPFAMAMNGDTYLDVNYAEVLEHHVSRRENGVLGTLAVSRLDDASRFGTVLLNESEEFVTGFQEKSKSPAGQGGWLNAGVYVLERDLLDDIPADRPVSIERDTFPQLLNAGAKLAAYRCQAPFYDIGTPDDFLRFQGIYKTLK